jgi:hypothetical protein
MKQKGILIATFIINSLFICSCIQKKYITKTYEDYLGNTFRVVRFDNDKIITNDYITSNGDTIAIALKFDHEPQLLQEDQTMIENLEWPTIADCFEGNIYAVLMIDNSGSVIDRRIIKEIPGLPECNQIVMEGLNNIKYIKPAFLNGVAVKCIKIIRIPFRTK